MGTITQFNRAAPWVLSAEGGYVNDASDRGGETKYGISKAAFPDVDIVSLTKGQALDIYQREFWDKSRCGEMRFIPAMCLFDARVNHQWKSSGRVFQRAAGVNPDGIIGSQSIAAANSAEGLEFLSQYLSYRADLYADIVAANTTQAKFRRGWFRRLFLLQQYILHETFTLEVGAK